MYHIVWSPIAPSSSFSRTNRQQFVDVYFHFISWVSFCLLHEASDESPKKNCVYKHEIPKRNEKKSDKRNPSMLGIAIWWCWWRWNVWNVSSWKHELCRRLSKWTFRGNTDGGEMCSERDLIEQASNRLRSRGEKSARFNKDRFAPLCYQFCCSQRMIQDHQNTSAKEWKEGETSLRSITVGWERSKLNRRRSIFSPSSSWKLFCSLTSKCARQSDKGEDLSNADECSSCFRAGLTQIYHVEWLSSTLHHRLHPHMTTDCAINKMSRDSKLL